MKDTIYKMKFLATEQDKIADKVFEFRVNKELIQASNNRQFFKQKKRFVQTLHKGSCMNDQKAHEKMLSLISHQGNAI